jgi:hypothetical protein
VVCRFVADEEKRKLLDRHLQHTVRALLRAVYSMASSDLHVPTASACHGPENSLIGSNPEPKQAKGGARMIFTQGKLQRVGEEKCTCRTANTEIHHETKKRNNQHKTHPSRANEITHTRPTHMGQRDNRQKSTHHERTREQTQNRSTTNERENRHKTNPSRAHEITPTKKLIRHESTNNTHTHKKSIHHESTLKDREKQQKDQSILN